MTLRDNQLKKSLASDNQHRHHHFAATPTRHPDCRRALTQIVALHLGRTKNGELRTAHIPDPLYEELSSVPKKLRTGPMFHWSHKSHVHRPLRNACKKAGLPYLSPHKLGRHTYATWLRRYAHRDLRGLMEDGGWKSVNSVLRYAHVVPGETAVAVDKLPSVQSSRRRKAKRATKPEKSASRRTSGDSLN